VSPLDLKGERCPMNLVRVRLALEPLPPGAALEVWVWDAEGLQNLPKSLSAQGHRVEAPEGLSLPPGAPARLIIHKGA